MSDERGQRIPQHAPGSVRHAEKRRTGSCGFADRIARVSLDAYRSCVPQSFQEHQKTCVATVVAHFSSDDILQVMGLGAGTKFLPEALLREEERDASSGSLSGVVDKREYGFRVRDCHGEVLARRAFRRQLSLEMKLIKEGAFIGSAPASYRPILRQAGKEDIFDLVDGVTLHFYSSSAPCGNAVLKKFAKMERETFNPDLGSSEWPDTSHEPVQAHSLRLGQFALLIKKDSTAAITDKPTVESHNQAKGKAWPAMESDDWCPPGTSIVSFHKGSIHTCSDKICRWNCLGLQGSFLASMLNHPLYMSTITVGRKLTGCICRRAVCCRADGFGEVRKSKRKRSNQVNAATDAMEDSKTTPSKYSLHHPAVMGTGVYMDESGKMRK